MAVSKEDILETISNMSVMDVVELIEAMEEKFGVSAAAAVNANVNILGLNIDMMFFPLPIV